MFFALKSCSAALWCLLPQFAHAAKDLQTRVCRARRIFMLSVAACLGMQLIACTSLPASDTVSANEDMGVWGTQSMAGVQPKSGAPWRHNVFPGKQPTRFVHGVHAGRHGMYAQADASASMLRKQVRLEPSDLGMVKFSWLVPELIDSADMTLRELDDSPVRIVLAFEGDRSRFSAKNASLSELARLLTGEEMPYATLMYVWSNQHAPGSVIINPRTDRVRKLVVESGSGKLGRWLDYERNIRADYEKAFGEAPGALVAVALMTDADNTRSVARAWYGPLNITKTVVAQP